MTTENKYWHGEIDKCEICHKPIYEIFVDGATIFGPWAIMCIHCFNVQGKGVGNGKGQMYQIQDDEQWMKIK